MAKVSLSKDITFSSFKGFVSQGGKCNKYQELIGSRPRSGQSPRFMFLPIMLGYCTVYSVQCTVYSVHSLLYLGLLYNVCGSTVHSVYPKAPLVMKQLLPPIFLFHFSSLINFFLETFFDLFFYSG